MSYYKIGDRVKIIQISADSKDIKVGDEGTIMNLISAHLFRIKLDNDTSFDLKARQFEKAGK
ncbi:MAG: hypothetical protein DHS20C17_16920 [Cyclobacteriaceae bacterium]|nr:MAG: hypothetical protein DHS20C17_16920 [Cyclobacteriaceae bacterium]